MMRIGLTGGIASGKSTVASWLRANGVPVADADQVAREVLAPGSEAVAELSARLGPGLVGADGVVDRAALRARVAADAGARRALEAVTHPRIRAAAAAWCASVEADGHPVAVWEAALLVESGAHAAWGRLLVVACPPQVQEARLRARSGLDAPEAARWVAAQASNAQRFSLADAVIWNNGAPEGLPAAAAAAWAALGGPALPLRT